MKWARVVLSFCGFVLIGVSGGVNGVLIPSQLADYRIDKVTLGITFFTFSAGYVASGVANGLLVRRLGVRGHIGLGAAAYLVLTLAIGLHLPFPVFVLASLLFGTATGIIDSGLNAYVSTLPGHTALLNFLHAFFGVGALIGPAMAALMLRAHLPWQDTYLVLAGISLPILIGCFVLLPRRVPEVEDQEARSQGPSMALTVRRPEVWLGATFLCLYVGVEVSVGNWSFSFLTQHRGQAELFAGYVVSGYWLGLTLGRFLLNALASVLGVDVRLMVYGCLGGLLLAGLLTWFGPGAVLATVGFGLIGFFLGPLFPTMIAVLPRMTPARLVANAIGVLVGMSVVGGAVFPYVAGALAQGIGLGSLMPYILLLSVLLIGSWWTIDRRLKAIAPPSP